MITVEEAFNLVLSTAADPGEETVDLEQSCGRILRQGVFADRDFPPFDRVCMDGIAIDYQVYAKGRREFYRQGVLSAGEAPPALVGPEACVEVMTGAVLPPGTDTVIPYEHLEELQKNEGTWFNVGKEVNPGQHIHSKGSDAIRGTELLKKGTRIIPPMIAVMASAGFSRVRVNSIPKISIICNGDELVPVSQNPLPHEIRQSNGQTLQALLQQYGVSSRLYHVRDEPAEMERLFQQIRSEQTDCIITSGGVSAGKKDYIPAIMEKAGGETIFHNVAQRPGKPFLFGKWKNGPVLFGLPGNPVSSMAGCCRYIIPWVWQCLGVPPSAAYAALSEDVVFDPPLTYLLPVSITFNTSGESIARPLRGKGSGDFISVRMADGFMELPPDESLFRKGNPYRIWPL